MSTRQIVLKAIICFIFFGFNSCARTDIVTVTQDESYVYMTTSELKMQIKRNPWQISVLDKNNNVLIRETETKHYNLVKIVSLH